MEYRIRRAKASDVEGIVRLIKTLYDDRYCDPDCYEVQTFRNHLDTEAIYCYVCEDSSGEIIATEGCSESELFPQTLLLRLKMTLPKYQSKGIGSMVTQYFMENFDFSQWRSSYADVLSYREPAQRILHKYGYVLTGFLMNVFIKNEDLLSGGEIIPKRSYTCMVRNEGIRSVGKLYVPAMVQEIAVKIYDSLGALIECSTKVHFPKSKQSIIVVDGNQRSFNDNVLVRTIGQNFVEKIQRIISRKQDSLQTFNILVNMRDRGANWAYTELQKLGCRFCGFKPLGKEEYYIMYYSEEISIYQEALFSLDCYREIKDEILGIAERRIL